MPAGKLLLLTVTLLLNSFTIYCQLSLPAVPVIRSDSIDGVVVAKKEVKLYCDVEDSNSLITWYYNGQLVSLPNNMSVEISAGAHDTLTIPEFRTKNNGLSHVGNWQCARDRLISNRLQLSKARIKKFSNANKDVVVDVIEGSTALLPCEPPTSRPRADVVFEINGATIDETQDRFYLLSSGDLQIANVQASDNGTYRCVAINKVLDTKEQAPNTITLRVLSRIAQPTSAPRTISWSQGRRATIVEGDELSLPCVFNGNPQPLVEWGKYLGDIPTARSEILLTNTLVIQNVEYNDSGTYNCVAESTLSNTPAVQTYTVDVLRIPHIAFPARELYAEEGTSKSIKCILEQRLEVTYDWYHNGEKIAEDGNTSSVQATGGELLIRDVAPADAGIYQCIASNEVGQDSSYVKFYVEKPHTTTTTTTTTPSTSVPASLSFPEPSAPTVEQIRREGVRLMWSIASNDQVMSFRIKMKGKSDDGWRVIVRNLARQETSTEINSDLESGMKYRFIVVALYRGQVEIESPPSARVRLDPDLGYEETTPVTAPPIVTKEVTALPTMSTAIGSTIASSNQVMIEPQMPTVTVISSDEVHLVWVPITEGLPVQFYKIQYRLLGPGSDGRWITVDGTVEDFSFYRITNLESDSTYKFRVAAVYINDEHKVSKSTKKVRMLSTKDRSGAVLRAPQSVPRLTAVRQTANDTLVANWVYNGATHIDSFIVQYRVSPMASDDSPGTWLEHPVVVADGDDWRISQAAITKLEPNKSYLIRVIAINTAGQSNPGNVYKRPVVVPYIPGSWGSYPSRVVTPAPAGDDSGVKADDDGSVIRKEGSSDMLYIILGAALGSMVLLLIVFVAICGFKQRQQRRAMLAVSRGSQNKFADASKVLYSEQLKQSVNGSTPHQFVTLGNGGTNGGMGPGVDSTLASINSHRMSLNINPLNELDEDLVNGSVRDIGPQQYSRDHNGSVDYNLMQHYPHYNNSANRHTPTMPYHHHSHHSIDTGSHHDGSVHYSQGSLPHYNVHQQYERSRSGTPQFSTFLPQPNQEDPSALPPANKLPHPQGLRPMHYGQGPVVSAFEPPQNNQQRRRRKKRSQHNRDHIINQSSGGSGLECNTNTDLSSGEGTGAEEYNQMLPPPPLLPSSYVEPAIPHEHQPLEDGYRERSNSDNAADTLNSDTDHIDT